MNRANGWIFFFVALGAAAAVYAWDRRSNVHSTAQGGDVRRGSVTTTTTRHTPYNTSGQQVWAGIDSPGADVGESPNTNGQTEAAYNQSTDFGAGDKVTVGATLADTDYADYADPSEVYGL